MIPQQVLDAYMISGDSEIIRVGGTKNYNFHVKNGDNQLFMRKRHPDYSQKEWIDFDHQTVTYLSSHNVAVLAPVACCTGESFFNFDGFIYEAYPWISGNPFVRNEDSVCSVAENLGLLHKVGQHYSQEYVKSGYARSEMSPDRLFENLSKSKDYLEPAVYDFYFSQLQIASQRFTDEMYDNLSKTIVHGDVQPANTIFSGSSLCAFVDYDWMARHPVIYDLSFAVMFFCGDRDYPIEGDDIFSLTAPFEFNEEMAKTFMQTYMQTTGEFPSELRKMFMEQIRLTWAHARIDGALKVPTSERNHFLSRSIKDPFNWIDLHQNGDWF